MRRLSIAIGLVVAALATYGQLKNQSNPLVVNGAKIPVTQQDYPFPPCPPDCGFKKH